MRVQSLSSREIWDRHLSRWAKVVKRAGRPPVESRAVFICGKQRSGTTMLIDVLDLHPHTDVFNESQRSAAFHGYELRELSHIEGLVAESRATIVCFKPLMDSYRCAELLERFPESKVVWMFRHYGDVANSTLRKFDNANVNIRKVCEGRPGGDSLRRELDSSGMAALRAVYRPELPDFDVSCLVWWVRNRLALAPNLRESSHFRLEEYEALVRGGVQAMNDLLDWIGLDRVPEAFRYVHAESVRKNATPPLEPSIQRMCDELLSQLQTLATRRTF